MSAVDFDISGMVVPLWGGIEGHFTPEEVSRLERLFDAFSRVDAAVAAPSAGVKRRERTGEDIDGCCGV